MRVCTRIVWLVVGLWAGVTAPARAQEARKYSNEFLRIGVGARAAGMGSAVTSWVDDATAGYWNPAGLTAVERRFELTGMHSEYFAGIAKFDHIGFAAQIDSTRSLGITAIRLGIDDIPNTLDIYRGGALNLNNITSFSEASLAVFLSYAQKLTFVPGLSVGGSLKVINRTAGPFATAWGFGIDLGVQYRRDRFSAGLVVSDATNTFNAWSYNTEAFGSNFVLTGNELPEQSLEITRPSARLGFGYRLPWRKFNMTAAADMATTFDGPRNTLWRSGDISYDPRFGLEVGYRDLAYLRGGVMNFQRLQREDGSRYLDVFPTAGMGVNIPLTGTYQLQVDYALSNIGDFGQGLYSHLVSLRFAFDAIKL